jgi:hypothetical protein
MAGTFIVSLTVRAFTQSAHAINDFLQLLEEDLVVMALCERVIEIFRIEIFYRKMNWAEVLLNRDLLLGKSFIWIRENYASGEFKTRTQDRKGNKYYDSTIKANNKTEKCFSKKGEPRVAQSFLRT